MKYGPEKFGIFFAIAVTAGVIAIGSSIIMSDGFTIQPQGQAFLENAATEVSEVPADVEQMAERTTNVAQKTIEEPLEELGVKPSDAVPETLEEINNGLLLIRQKW